MNGNDSCPAYPRLPRVLGSLPWPAHSPLCFCWGARRLRVGLGFQLVWLPPQPGSWENAESSGLMSHPRTRRKRGQVAWQGAAHRELLREGLASLLSRTPCTVKPLNANCEVTLETTASFCALAGADRGMSQNPKRLNRRQRFSWS